jgi:uncharacterized RDD family membrane protein YckC
MKCPKCSYLGFETGDRCKNCGYDFSLLLSDSDAIDAKLSLREPEGGQAPDIWLDRIDTALSDVAVRTAREPAAASSISTAAASSISTAAPSSISSAAAPASSAAAVSPATTPQPSDLSFPLFAPKNEEDDEPLIKLPAAPRPPLAVRRTPEQPHLRPSPRSLPQEESRLALDVVESLRPETEDFRTTPVTVPVTAPVVSGLPRRAAAGLIDLAILFGVDFVIVYSTLQMSALTLADWALLPAAPMLAFLGLLKLSYFGAFTAACGQTIGKMAMRIKVIADDATLDPARAARRTLVSAVSVLAVGTGFIPVLVDADRRALHDRVAGTRVVELPSV